MNYASLIPAGLSILGSVLGGGKSPSNPYLPQINSELASEGQQASKLTGLGASAQNTYNQFNPQANRATQSYADYLAQNPYTNVVNEAMLNRATNSTTAAYQQARAQLAASIAARGMGGGNSGLLTGGLADIDSAQANTLGNAQNNLALGEIGDLGNRMGERAGLLSDAANSGFGGATTAYGDASRIYGDIAGTYAGVGQAQEEDQMRQQQAQNDIYSQLGEGLGMALAPQAKPLTNDDIMALLQKIYQSGTPTNPPPAVSSATPNIYSYSPYGY